MVISAKAQKRAGTDTDRRATSDKQTIKMLRMRETAVRFGMRGPGGSGFPDRAGKYEGREVIRASLGRRIFRRESLYVC